MKMIKQATLTAIILLCAVLTACSGDTNGQNLEKQTAGGSVKGNAQVKGTPNKAVEKLGAQREAGAVAAILNNADRETAKKAGVADTESFNSGEAGGETVLLIPFEAGQEIKIERVEYDPNTNNFKLVKVLYSVVSTDDGAIELTLLRPEGAPVNRISVTAAGKEHQYLFAYNGKTGNVGFEYIK